MRRSSGLFECGEEGGLSDTRLRPLLRSLRFLFCLFIFFTLFIPLYFSDVDDGIWDLRVISVFFRDLYCIYGFSSLFCPFQDYVISGWYILLHAHGVNSRN